MRKTKILNKEGYRVKVITRLENGERLETFKDFNNLESAEIYAKQHYKYRRENGYKHILETSYIYKF